MGVSPPGSPAGVEGRSDAEGRAGTSGTSRSGPGGPRVGLRGVWARPVPGGRCSRPGGLGCRPGTCSAARRSLGKSGDGETRIFVSLNVFR